ncbi:MAG: GNAT family N-acetyltransferase, partial [Gammaproteobacteria bacterium]|nr:GNAT family N-acetyltransferase [Gammaproteobacteria bacterium]
HSYFARGWLRLYCLEINQRLAAIYYCYRFRNEIFYFQSGFDPAYEAYSPGQALLGFAVEHAISEGNQVFDLLKGDHHYKSQWANSSRETTGIAVYRPTLAGHMAKLRWQTAPAAVRILKHWMSVGAA